MQEDPNTDNTDSQTPEFLIDCEDWELAFEPYEGHPSAALRFGFNVAMLRKELETQLFRSQPVLEALDQAMKILFPYTTFHDVSFDLFIKLTEGKLTFEEEQMLTALGVKF